MPAVYDKLGIRFLYPDNWTLDEQEAGQGNCSVFVHSPGGAFWSITLHEAGTDPGELVAKTLDALKEEYAHSETEEASEQVCGQTLSGYDLSFRYVDLSNTALIRGFRTATASCLLLCQAEDRDFEELAPVFRAITTSLLMEGAGR